jgi:N-methylhydantoinase A/oxoprolinase/acetone carboxylase beta subunit
MNEGESVKVEDRQPRVFVIACGVLARDIEAVTAEWPCVIGTHYLPAGLHERPDKLRRKLQAAIDRVSPTGQWDRIAVGYGVCGRGTVDLRSRDVPLAIPRVHDCIALFLGGDRRYRQEFERYPGTYYISHGWHEAKSKAKSADRRHTWMGDTKVYFDELVARYGRAHAESTFAFLESWRSNYQRAAFIDTGTDTHPAAEAYARELADQNRWRFEKIAGSTRLLKALLEATRTSAEILVVPPGQITVFDAANGRLAAHPVSAGGGREQGAETRVVMKGAPRRGAAPGSPRVGLGIDAGGTYTDAVIYDFSRRQVRAKSKALTTRWDFAVGIREALGGIAGSRLADVGLVSISTTLATNAIVEGEGQRVGLLLMPPPGFDPYRESIHAPQEILSARLDITGAEISPVEAEEVRRAARRMCAESGVEAFAVSGYAGSINPAHEAAVKEIVRAETGRFVSCGHELSQLLNFKMRGLTAVQNARIVPRLRRLLEDIAAVLAELGIRAPVMVVRGDGSLMSQALAMERPVETILSGPAASVAGARHLTGLDDAVVIDMGGTTTDIAALENGRVRLCESGSRVGPVRTHVRALEIQTEGLGGDSLILCQAGEWRIGPRRVAPIAWLGRGGQDLDPAFNYLSANRRRLGGNLEAAQMFTLNHRQLGAPASALEKRILELLGQRPYSLLELAEAAQVMHSGLLPLDRLESEFAVQRCGLTPTDLLHCAGRFVRWNAAASHRMLALAAGVAGSAPEALQADLLSRVARRLTMEIIRHQLAAEHRSEAPNGCPTCNRLFENLLAGGERAYAVRFELRRPIIGVGAPIGHFLPEVAGRLGTRARVPEFHDVANAVGAITSRVILRRLASVRPDPAGGFYIEGLAGHPRFPDLESADAHVRGALAEEIRRLAVLAGTREEDVRLTLKDVTARTPTGDDVFIERQVVSEIQGLPDRV